MRDNLLVLDNKHGQVKAQVEGCERSGSQGLGLALAKQLVSQGAHVTICSRSLAKLELACKELEKERINETQKIALVSADVSSFAGAQRAIEQCSVTPDIVFCCAGGAKPGLFIEQTEADFEAAVKTDYLTALSTAHVSQNDLT
ncbi:hypothetical protein MYAM1_003473 [Malassezia yamatoensis]|uniref:Uncharacterized protein n=1 Tax=Malassezia yamatoensis TaxID=253288 RepID=A0AAJ6CIX7_9BASI|nr:hypothetical protein MYAM1_003473 [Malassezia yamatoensis]